MERTRRDFLKTAAATGAVAAVPATAASAHYLRSISSEAIVARFAALPGDVAFKILAPSPRGRKAFVASLNSDRMLFVASAIKSYLLCEALRQVDSPHVVDILEQRALPLDATIWSLGSPIFNPPNLSGTVSERTAMEAMITRSDNTATDMIFKVAGADNVRAFVADAGLVNTLVPDSTRALAAYVFGADDYKNISWEKLLEAVTHPPVHPFLNSVETLASSADDFVSYYSRALQGAFFDHAETLDEFRRILTLCDFIYLIPVPLAASVYAKSGNVDTAGFHVRTFAGGLNFGEHWIYFAFIVNWYAEDDEDPDTVARIFAAIHDSLADVKAALSKD